MLMGLYEDGLIESPESLYSAFSKVSHGKAIKRATSYWSNKIENILPDLPERRREKPTKLDFISITEFEEKVSKYQKDWFQNLKFKYIISDQKNFMIIRYCNTVGSPIWPLTAKLTVLVSRC